MSLSSLYNNVLIRHIIKIIIKSVIFRLRLSFFLRETIVRLYTKYEYFDIFITAKVLFLLVTSKN